MIYYGNNVRRDVVKKSSTEDEWYITKNISGLNDPLSGSFIGKAPYDKSEYWESFGANFQSVATGLLFADKALISGWNFNDEMIWSQNDNMGLDGRSSESIRMWLGATAADRANAPTRLMDDGTIYTEKLVANQGRLGDHILIRGGGLTNEGFNTDDYIILRNDKYDSFAGIGANVLPSTTGHRSVARFENNNTSGQYGINNYALLVKASGAISENNAILMQGGWLSGLSIKVRQVSSTGNLTHSDVYISCYNNTQNIILYLPASPEKGKVYFIKRMNSYGVDINGNGISIHHSQGSISAQVDIAHRGATMMLVYDGQYWCYNHLSN